MPALQTPEFWTRDMVLALPEDRNRYETVHGELFVTPMPRVWHQVVADRVTSAIKGYLKNEPVGMVIGAGGDISWGADVLVQPDVFVAPLEEIRTLDWAKVKSLLLVVEVLSPSTSRADRFAKRRLYQEVGIPLYWIVDADQHHVECWTPAAIEPVIEHERIIWQPARAETACVTELKALFEPL